MTAPVDLSDAALDALQEATHRYMDNTPSYMYPNLLNESYAVIAALRAERTNIAWERDSAEADRDALRAKLAELE